MLKSTRLVLIVALLLFALANGGSQTFTANAIDDPQMIKRDVGSMTEREVGIAGSEKHVHDKRHGNHDPVTPEEFRHFVGNYSFFEAFPERSMDLCHAHFHRCRDHLHKDHGVSATVVANWQLHVQERCAPDFDHCRRASDHFRYSHPFPTDRCLRSPYPTAKCRNKGFCDVRNRQCAGEWTHHHIGDKKEAGKECSDLFRCVNRKDVREDSLAVCVNHIKDHGDNGDDLGADKNAEGAIDMTLDDNVKNDAHRSAEVKKISKMTSEGTPWMKDSSCDASDQCEWVLHPDGSTREAPLLPIPNCHIHPHTPSPADTGSGSQATGEDGNGARSKHKTFFQKFKILLIVIAGATVLAGGLIMLKLSRPAPGQPRFEFEDEPWSLPSAPQRDPVRWYGLLTPEDLVDKERKVSAKRSSTRLKKAPPMITPPAVPVRTAADVREYPQQGSPTSGLYEPPLAQGAHAKGKIERASAAATTSSATDGGGDAFGATVMESCGETSSSGELRHEEQHHEAKSVTATSPSSGKQRRLRRAASVTFEGSPKKNPEVGSLAEASPPTFKLDMQHGDTDTAQCERGEGRVCIRASCDTNPSEIRATAPRYLLLPCRCEWCGCHEPAGQERKNPQQNKHRNRLIAALAGRFAATSTHPGATSMQHAPSEQSLADLEAGLLPRHDQGFHLNTTGSQSVVQPHGDSGNDVRDRPVLESVVGINTVEYGLRVGAPTVPHSTDPSKATYGCVRCGEAIDHIVDIHGLFAEPETGPGLDLSVKEEENRQLEEQQRKRASLRRRRRTYDDDDDERSASAVSAMSSSNSRSVSANRTAHETSNKTVHCRPPSMTVVGVGPKKVHVEGQDALSASECRSPRRCPSAALDAPFASPPRPRRAASGLSSDRRSTPAARGREVTSPVHKSTLPPRPASLARLSGASVENCGPPAALVNVDRQHVDIVQQRGRTARSGSNGGTPVSVVVRSGSFSSSRGHQTSNRSTPSDPALTKSETSAPAFPALGSQEACDDAAAVAADRSSSAFSRGASSRHNSGLQTPPQCDVHPPASSGAQPRHQQPASKETCALHGVHGTVVGVPMHRSGRSDRSGAGSATSAHSHMSGQSGKSYVSRRTSFCALAASASDSRSYGSAVNGADGETMIDVQSQVNNGPLVHGGAAPDCVVCFSAPVSSAFLPCGPLATCDECAGRICDATQQQRQHVVRGDGDDNARLETGALCPLCRAIVAAVVVLDERQASGAAQAAHVADEQRCHAGRHPL